MATRYKSASGSCTTGLATLPHTLVHVIFISKAKQLIQKESYYLVSLSFFTIRIFVADKKGCFLNLFHYFIIKSLSCHKCRSKSNHKPNKGRQNTVVSGYLEYCGYNQKEKAQTCSAKKVCRENLQRNIWHRVFVS